MKCTVTVKTERLKVYKKACFCHLAGNDTPKVYQEANLMTQNFLLPSEKETKT